MSLIIYMMGHIELKFCHWLYERVETFSLRKYEMLLLNNYSEINTLTNEKLQ